jgi:tetraacyldisaccharide 4'-kinase
VTVRDRLEALVLHATRTESPSATERIARGVLAAVSLVFGAGVRLRNAGYDCGLFPVHQLPCRVVAIGNLTVGGTGKTPTVMTIASALRAAGERVCIVLRGYRGAGTGARVVSDGRDIRLSWREAGDEAVLLAQSLPGVSVVVGADRVAAGRLAIAEFRPETILLDDGFQHRRIHRDRDLVLVDATDPFGGEWLLPRGRLREPVRGLRRADAILVTRADQATDLEGVVTRLAKAAPGRPIARGTYRACRLRELGSGRGHAVTAVRGKRVLAVSGIANPRGFHDTLEGVGAVLADRVVFRDHHPFTSDDRRRIAGAARASGAEWIVTTEKDGVRLAPDDPDGIPILALGVALDVGEGAEAVESALGLPVRGRGPA